MMQDGIAIVIRPYVDLDGVKFTFRDTAANEEGFDVLRAEADFVNQMGYTMTEPELVVQIPSDLRGCHRSFSSMTVVDRDAAFHVGKTFRYLIQTKLPTEDARMDRIGGIYYTVRRKTEEEEEEEAFFRLIKTHTHTHTHTHNTRLVVDTPRRPRGVC